jgi:hypothetical protein
VVKLNRPTLRELVPVTAPGSTVMTSVACGAAVIDAALLGCPASASPLPFWGFSAAAAAALSAGDGLDAKTAG